MSLYHSKRTCKGCEGSTLPKVITPSVRTPAFRSDWGASTS